MDKLRNPIVQGQLRHLLTFSGPIITILLISEDPIALLESLVHPENFPNLVGFLMAGLGFYLSINAPEKKPKDDEKEDQ